MIINIKNVKKIKTLVGLIFLSKLISVKITNKNL